MDSSVLIVDAQTRAVAGNIPLNSPGRSVNRLVGTPDGTLLFGIAAGSSPARLFVFDIVTREVAASILADVRNSFWDLLIDFTGTRLYLLQESAVVVYDTATLTEAARISVEGNPRFNRFSLSFDGGTLFANHAYVNRITRIDTATNRVIGQIGDGRAVDGSMIVMAP
jgi:DNA-binding beta-propeller fold protein YncE